MLRTSIVSLLIVLITCPCYAQKVGLKKPKVWIPSARSILESQILAAERRRARKPNVKVSRVNLEPVRTLSFPSVAEIRKTWGKVDPVIMPVYERSVKSFTQAKRDLIRFFDYQRLEPTYIDPFRKLDVEEQLQEAQQNLANITSALSAEDPRVQVAQTFLTEVFEALHPTYVFRKDELVTVRPARELVDREFLLWSPEATHSELMQTIRVRTAINEEASQKAAQLPKRSVAFINDDPEMRDWARQWAAQGYFGPGSQLALFDSVESFMQRLDGNVSYDLVLIDWVLEDGFALPAVQKIRSSSNSRSLILLNSALLEDEVKTQEMFDYGVDGFISSVGFRHDTGGARIALALWNYEYYKKLHNWAR